MESIDKRTCALSIVGMAFVWAPLHTSGYYPLSLVFTSQTAPVAEISAYHIVYTIAFVLVAAILMLARRRVQEALDRSRTLPFACAAVGLLGSGLLAASPLFAGSSSIAVGVGMVLTVPAQQADKALELLHANGEPEAYRLGVIAEGEGVELC